ILCEILTGQPPFPGKSAEALRMAKTAQLDEAHGRLEACGADIELISLAKRCTAAEPWNRPRNAQAVSDEITAYQDSAEKRLRMAELEGAEAKARVVEARKRQRVMLALAASLLALVVTGAGAGFYLQRQAAERKAEQARQHTERDQAVESFLEKAAELQRQSRWPEAMAMLEQAAHRFDGGESAELRQMVDQAQLELTLVTRLDAARLQAATVGLSKLD